MAESANPSSPASASVIRSPNLKSHDQTSSPSPPRNRKRTNSTASTASNASSGEACCAICLGKPENKCYTNSCLHHFCFACLLEWSKVKPECPLCKQKFKSIIHNVRSLEEFDEYHVRAVPEEVNPAWLSRFRYRTTLTADRRPQDFSLRRAFATSVLPGLPYRPGLRRVATSDFRRSIYEDDIWARPVADITGRYRESNPAFYRENPAVTHRLIPWLNRELNALLTGRPRLRHCNWDVSHVLQTVTDLITSYTITSPEFASAMRPYLGQYTDHFVHEFYNFARSPLDMIGYDMEVEYGPYNTQQNAGISVVDESTESDDSDIVFMGRHHTVPHGPDFRSRLLRGPVVRCTRVNETTPAEVDFTNVLRFLNEHRPFSPPGASTAYSRVSRDASATQSPQPGPSGLQPRFSGRSTPALDSDSEDIEIVDVVKPKRERTPEVVILSDTDEEDSGVSVQPSEPGPSTSSATSSEYQATPSTSASIVVPRYAETITSSVPSSSSTSSRHICNREDQKTERRSRRDSEDTVDKHLEWRKRPRRVSTSSSPEPSQERGKAWRSNGPSSKSNARKEERSKKEKKSKKASKRSRRSTSRKRRRVLERSPSSSSDSENEKRNNPVRRRSPNKADTLPRYWDLAGAGRSSPSYFSRRDTTYTERSKR